MNKLPELKLDHLFNLTDSTGIIQHARYHIPDRKHGYCLDDNARALLVIALYKKNYVTNSRIEKLAETYLSFIDHAYNPISRKYRNFMNYAHEWLEEEGSDDSQGRTLWAVGTLAADPHFEYLHFYLEKLLDQCMHREFRSPNSIAFALLGLTELAKENKNEGFPITEIIQNQTEKLWNLIQNNRKPGWLWCSGVVTYDGCRIPQSLISAGYVLANPALIKEGLKILDWLIIHQFKNEIFVPIGNDGWMTEHQKADFDQQPLETAAMIDACIIAGTITQNPKYFASAVIAFNWFTGSNLIGESLYDPLTGGCRDGIGSHGTNKNQGAESTLSWLSSLLTMQLFQEKLDRGNFKNFRYESL